MCYTARRAGDKALTFQCVRPHDSYPQQIVTQIGHLERQRSEIEGAIERLRATQSRLALGRPPPDRRRALTGRRLR